MAMKIRDWIVYDADTAPIWWAAVFFLALCLASYAVIIDLWEGDDGTGGLTGRVAPENTDAFAAWVDQLNPTRWRTVAVTNPPLTEVFTPPISLDEYTNNISGGPLTGWELIIADTNGVDFVHEVTNTTSVPHPSITVLPGDTAAVGKNKRERKLEDTYRRQFKQTIWQDFRSWTNAVIDADARQRKRQVPRVFIDD